MTLELEYYVDFGPGDSSDTLEWEVELTPEEEEAYQVALENGDDLEKVLSDAIARAREEIMEQEQENMADMDMEWEDGWDLVVQIVEPDEEEDES